jgi:DNA modification methylase
MKKVKYKKVARSLDREYENCESAEEYLRAIMRIWTENGLIEGEWSCDLVGE